MFLVPPPSPSPPNDKACVSHKHEWKNHIDFGENRNTIKADGGRFVKNMMNKLVYAITLTEIQPSQARSIRLYRE